MARLASTAVAGFFPASEPIIDALSSYFERVTYRIAVLDPCAGEGKALCRLAEAICDEAYIFGAEMERTRFKKLMESQGSFRTQANGFLLGDSLRAVFNEGHIHLLYLNPPYDSDSRHRRLEERFLSRYLHALAEDGYLAFLVPYYALAASAETLATHFHNLDCYRVAEFDEYKQVMLVGQKRPALLEPNPVIRAQVEAWARDVSEVPELTVQASPKYFWSIPKSIQHSYYSSPFRWSIEPVDLKLVQEKVRPWEWKTPKVNGPVSSVVPALPVADMLLRTYPVVTAPKPAHIASGIASGLFNGAKLTAPGMPSILVKGVFDREFRTIDEKEDKEGKVTQVQVQAPKLVITVLDLEKKTYHTLPTGTTGSSVISEMGVGDLLEKYSDSLAQVMAQQCPVAFDPKTDTTVLGPTKRELYRAQQDATKALSGLIQRNNVGILLGEIGVGKTTVALATISTLGAKRPLVVCPPQLLDMWAGEVKKVLPDFEVRVLSEPKDFEALPERCVGILSRERAKLSHGMGALTHGDSCPKCGSLVPKGDHAKKRSFCQARKVIYESEVANLAMRVAAKLAPFAPENDIIRDLLRSRMLEKKLSAKPRPFNGFSKSEVTSWVLGTIASLGQDVPEEAIFWACAIDRDEDRIRMVMESMKLDSAANFGYLVPNSPLLKEIKSPIWLDSAETKVEKSLGRYHYGFYGKEAMLTQSGEVQVKGEDAPVTPLGAALKFLSLISRHAKFKLSSPCGEPLFFAVPDPRRYALSRYITRYERNTFDFLVLDEAHEASAENSAQTRSAHRLLGLRLPSLLMTGTIMNGYAESLFMNMWAASKQFREEFDRDDKTRFVERYGYRKRVVSDRPMVDDKKVTAYGSHSDRVETNERVIGNAPGVLPLFILRYLLAVSVTLHKSDLKLELPKCHEYREEVEPTSTMRRNYDLLKSTLLTQIKKDAFKEGLAGKLWGQLAELPSYMDRAAGVGEYEIRYPDPISDLVVSVPLLPPDTILPKEAWMVEKVRSELAEGRNCMILAWHISVLPRLHQILEKELGERVEVLYSDKVSTAKRQDWIDQKVVKKGVRVLISNPVTIQTGLNNLVHFATEIWMENCGCNPLVYRQTNGRVDRIGQRKETRIFFPVYKDTLQANLYDLLMRKVAVSISTDGLDPESAMFAAGLGEDTYLTGLSIGRQIWKIIQDDE